MRRTTPLADLRRARTLTQVDVARLLHVSQQTYSKYESGQVTPPLHTQARLAALLGVARAEAFPGSVERIAS